MQDPKNRQKMRHLGTIAQLCRAISSQMYRQSEKYLLNSNTSSTCSDNMMNLGLLTAEICWRVWGTPVNFNGFRVLAALLHGTLVVHGVSQTLRRWTDGATYIRQGGHHVGHWHTFLVSCQSFSTINTILIRGLRVADRSLHLVSVITCSVPRFIPSASSQSFFSLISSRTRQFISFYVHSRLAVSHSVALSVLA